ncbi:hypothetical protein [Balneatrix alpica]|uniref:Uncharacterized protein n=1 Tax=Balneatrix alpica TaxID=75684 RepID=A0ABV5ZBP9_9GAMM|nr:hypothetical protein [Balneatrix alpica]
MANLPRLQGVTPEGEVIELTLTELHVHWPQGLPLTINFEALDEGKSQLALMVNDGADEDEDPSHFGQLLVRPGACNLVEIEVETQEAGPEHDHDHDHAEGSGCC